jgi:hypothetical protein
MRQNYNTAQKQKKAAHTYAAIRIWPDTRILLRKIGQKTETYDEIIQNLIDSYIKKEETMLHRAIHNQDSTPANYGKLDATRQETSSLLSSSINKTMTSEDDFQRRTTIPG